MECGLFQEGLVHKVNLLKHQIQEYEKQGHYTNCQAETSDKDAKALAVQLTKFLQSFFLFFISITRHQLLVWTNIYKQKLSIFCDLYPCCSNRY